MRNGPSLLCINGFDINLENCEEEQDFKQTLTIGAKKWRTSKLFQDICNNKKTLLYIFSLQNAHKTHKELLLQWSQTSDFNEMKVNQITQIFKDSGAKDYVIRKRDYYYQQALVFLQTSSISLEDKDFLISFAQKAVDRIK